MPKIVGIIQARTCSTRLPKKVLKKLGDFSILEILLNRLILSKMMDQIIVATTIKKEDDVIEKTVLDSGFEVFRGSEEDVLDRYYKAALKHKADIIVRIVSDSPLTDVNLLDSMVKLLIEGNYDCVKPKDIILGLPSAVFTFNALKKAWKNGREKYMREHVTPYIYENPEYFKIKHVKTPKYIEKRDIRLTIDTLEDFKLFQELYNHFGDLIKVDIKDIVAFLDKNPQIKKINQKVRHKNYKEIEKKITIITEGGATMGLGHVYRTISLANKLKDYAKINFLTQSGQIIVDKIKNNGFDIYRASNVNVLKKQINFKKPDIIVIDRLEVAEQFARDIKDSFNPKVVMFGNISSANKYADIVVNAVIGTDCKNKSFIDENTDTLYLEGPKYLVLRDEFYSNRNSYRFKNNLKKILLTFGGSDPANLSSKVLGKLFDINYGFEINIVLGAQFKFYSELNHILEKHRDKKEKVNVYKDINNISELILNSDLVIASLGTTMFESFCIGAPTIAFYQNPYQKNVMFKNFIMAFDLDEIENFRKFMFDFYNNYYENKERVDALETGEGKDEIISSILKDN